MTMKRIGYWSTPEEPMLPDPREWVDSSWDMGERIKVIRYLRDGKFTGEHQNLARCRMGCKSSYGMGRHDMTDGSFVWPEGLAHYIECHSVKPPEEFVQHIRNNFYKVPAQSIIVTKKPA